MLPVLGAVSILCYLFRPVRSKVSPFMGAYHFLQKTGNKTAKTEKLERFFGKARLIDLSPMEQLQYVVHLHLHAGEQTAFIRIQAGVMGLVDRVRVGRIHAAQVEEAGR